MKRPNGKPYTSRKPPVVEYFEGDWPDEQCILVLRVSEDERANAYQMASEELEKWDCTLMNTGWFGWWRLAPRMNESFWIYDSVRGMPGWVFNVE
jgi:hypothetical protein